MYFPAEGSGLEVAAHGRQHFIIPLVQAVENCFGKLSGAVHGIKKSGKLARINEIVGAVEAGIRADGLQHTAGIIPQGADMELHRNIPCGVFFSQEREDVPLETAAFVECKRTAFHASGKDILCFFIGGRGVNAALQAVIRKQAAALDRKSVV